MPKLRTAAAHCRGCHLWRCGTQTVFGEGPRAARVLFVGEQPGDAEDKAGRPFVGPAGRLFDAALEAAGIDRDDVYLTNAVKHFKWARDGGTKRRIHKTPNAGEIKSCLPWLEAELALVKPRVVVCLGAIAAKALLGRTFSVTKQRGIRIESTPVAPVIIATVHPASVLRAPSAERKRAEQAFIADIRTVARELARPERDHSHSAGRRRKFSTWQTTARRSDSSSESTPSSRG